MVLRGSLETINLADIFQNLAMNQQTGTLSVVASDRTKCIYFHQGDVRYLSSGKRKNVLLGEMLMGRGFATVEQIGTALAEQDRSDRLLGEIVVDLGICSREDIDDLVRYQVEEEIYDLFGWERADFEFREGPPPDDLFDPEQQATELSINTSQLIMEAARRIDEWERIREVIPSTSEAFMPAVTALGADASAEQQRIFSFLDGTRDVDAVVDDSFFSRYEVASNLMVMLEGGSVRRATSDELKTGAAACLEREMPDRAARLLEAALALDPDDLAIREQLADSLIAQGQREKGAIHLSVLGDARAAQEDIDGAASAYERIIAILPRHAAALEKLARIRSQQGDKERAIAHYVALVQSLLEGGRLDEAAASCREGLKLDFENAELRNALARVLMSSGDKNGAIEEYGQLGEIFARGGRARPAAEVFRRILQIDPGNAYAKKRLTSILSGGGVVKRTHKARNFAIILVLALLAAGGYLVVHELAVQSRFDEAATKAAEHAREKRFDEARRVWKALESEWSLLLDCGEDVRGRLRSIDENERVVTEHDDKNRARARERIARILEAGQQHARAHEIEEAREAFGQVMNSAHATDEMKDAARSALLALEQELKDVDRFLAWHKTAVRLVDLASLELELERVRAILRKYPGNPRLQGLKRPLLVATDPPGANVFVDNAFDGPAPPGGLVIRFPHGTAPRIRAELAGYTSAEEPAPSALVRLELDLKREVAWKYDAKARVFSLAAGPGGMLLVANQAGVLAAVDPRAAGGPGGAREAAWPPFRAGERLIGIASGITVEGTAVYFGTDRLYSLTASVAGKSWRSRWVAPVGGRVLAPVTVAKVEMAAFREFVFGTCVDNAGVGAVWAVSSEDGKVKWRVQPSPRRKPTRSRPLLHGGNVIVSFDDGRLYALDATLDAAGGKPVGVWPTGSITTLTSPVWDGKMVWVGTGDGRLCAFDLARPGPPARRPYDVGRGVATDIVLRDGVAYFGDERGELHAVTLASLERPWPKRFRGDGRPAGAPAVGEKRVYFATASGRIYAVDRATGESVWEYKLDREVRGGVFFDGRYLYAGGADGYVYAFDEKTIP